MRSSAQNTDEKNKVQLTIDIREEELSPFVDQAVRKINRQAVIPGFRPGKAPRKILEARIGQKALRQQAIEDALDSYYQRALLDNGVDAIAAPGVEVVEGAEQGDVKVELSVEVRPVVTVEGYDELEIEIERPYVTDDDVEEYVKVLAEQVGQLKEVPRPAQEGDTVTVDLVVLVNGVEDQSESVSDLTFRVGRGQVDPQIEKAVVGKASGEVVEVSSKGQDQDEQPESEDNSEDSEAVAEDQVSEETDAKDGDDHVARVTVKSVKEMEIPELTDELASEISEFETLEELRNDIRSELSKMRLARARTMYRSLLVDSLLKLVEPKDIPQSLLSAEVDSQLHQFGHQLQSQGLSLRRYFELTNQSEQDVLVEVYGAAHRNVLFDLALRAVAYAEALEVTDEEIESYLAKRQHSGVDLSKSEEQTELERLEARVELLKEKAFKVLLKKARIKTTEGEAVELADIDPESAGELDGGVKDSSVRDPAVDGGDAGESSEDLEDSNSNS